MGLRYENRNRNRNTNENGNNCTKFPSEVCVKNEDHLGTWIQIYGQRAQAYTTFTDCPGIKAIVLGGRFEFKFGNLSMDLKGSYVLCVVRCALFFISVFLYFLCF